jgi:cytochrome P450
MQLPDDFDFLSPGTVDNPYPFYAALREHAPVYRVPGTDVYLVSKRRLIEEVLRLESSFRGHYRHAELGLSAE